MTLFRILLLAATLVFAAGCSTRPPRPADPEKARETLRQVLDAWKQGAAPVSLREQRPPIHVIDHEWQPDQRLVRYELQQEEPIGADLRCRVRLTLRANSGKVLHQQAIYSVATSPALTVTREEGN